MIEIGWKVGVLGLAFAAGCSSNPSTTVPTDSAADSGPSDVQSVGSPSDGGAGCYTLTSSASTEECAFSSCAVSGSSCAALPGSTFGSCPSSGLYGCCVQTRIAEGGENCLLATCYYSDAGRIPMSNCEANGYMGLPYVWELTSP
jgi:hypothetical protein